MITVEMSVDEDFTIDLTEADTTLELDLTVSDS